MLATGDISPDDLNVYKIVNLYRKMATRSNWFEAGAARTHAFAVPGSHPSIASFTLDTRI